MSDIKDKIKKLLKKAKDAGDHDMIELAMELLDEIPVDPPEFPEENKKFAEFTMKSENKLSKPLEVKKRVNKFVDDGTEFTDDHNKTPVVQLTERRRHPFKKVEQTCNRCNKSVEVHPQHARDFYVCDKCLRR